MSLSSAVTEIYKKNYVRRTMDNYTVFQKNWTTKLMAVTLSNLIIDFPIFFIVSLSDKFAIKVIVKDSTTP